MDYETPDGSQFSLREIWTEGEGEPKFRHTSISASVDGRPYCGKLDDRLDDIDEGDVLGVLEAVPAACIYPELEDGFTAALAFDPAKHYLKAPSFTWDDCQAGCTFVADCFLAEVRVLERLKSHPHPNLVTYHGCVVTDGRVTHLNLLRLQSSLQDWQCRSFDRGRIARIMADLGAAVHHLHSLGLAHNDLNPDNVCMSSDGNPVIVDFDSCAPFGEPLLKGVAHFTTGVATSSKGNDYVGLKMVEDFLYERCSH